MENGVAVLQVVIFASIWVVWVLRFDNIVAEFKHFGYSPLFRNFIGAVKLSLAALLIAGIRFHSLALFAACGMAALMVGAQITHLRVKNPLPKFLPSFALLALSLAVAFFHSSHP